jgi:hypothetical protein
VNGYLLDTGPASASFHLDFAEITLEFERQAESAIGQTSARKSLDELYLKASILLAHCTSM